MIGGYVRGEYVQWKCPDPVHGGSEANCTSRCIYTPGAFVIGRKKHKVLRRAKLSFLPYSDYDKY